MSGEYYSMESEDVSKLCNNKETLKATLSTVHEDLKAGFALQDDKLQEIEGNINWAENRCNDLTDCLDNLKNYYGYQKNEGFKLCTPQINKKTDNASNLNLVKKQQATKNILDEKPDAAMATVNNMIDLLTSTVNKLDSHQCNSNKFAHDKMIEELEKQYEQKVLKTVETSTDESTHTVIKKSSEMVKSNISTQNTSKLKKPFVKRRKTIEKVTKIQNPSSITMTKKKSMKGYRSTASRLFASKRNNNLIQVPGRKTLSQLKLIQLYHNEELKGSDSDEGQTKPSKPDNVTVPPIKIPANQANRLPIMRSNSVRTEYYLNKARSYEEPKFTRTELNYYSRNYQLPTIASPIPFCAATSITPSHNIGINIQQFMNLLKTNQPLPLSGLSRTLTHNIELAAERLNGQPLSSLVSTAASKLGVRCPVVKSNINYQHLQEMAKCIPEETIHEVDENDTPTVRSIVITGPAGDVKIKDRQTRVWTKESSTNSVCTCVPKEGVDFDQVVYKQSCHTNKVVSNAKLNKIGPVRSASKKTFTKSITKVNQNVAQNEQESSSLMGKEKTLKNVLTNLHQEFDFMNKTYNDLHAKFSADKQTAENVTELEKLEKELNNKEQEITMVMTLYKEVMALKQQLKKLQQPSTATCPASLTPSNTHQKIGEYTNSKTAFHLTKLLKQIQQYQINYKKDLLMC